MLCWMHGANGGARKDVTLARQDANTTFATLLASGERRPPWAVALDALHIADIALRDQWQRVLDLEELPADELARLLELARYAHSMASATVTTRATELRAIAEQARVNDVVSKIQGVFRAAFAELSAADMGLTWQQRNAVEDAIWRYFDEQRHPATRELEAAMSDEVIVVQATTTNGDGGR